MANIDPLVTSLGVLAGVLGALCNRWARLPDFELSFLATICIAAPAALVVSLAMQKLCSRHVV